MCSPDWSAQSSKRSEDEMVLWVTDCQVLATLPRPCLQGIFLLTAPTAEPLGRGSSIWILACICSSGVT